MRRVLALAIALWALSGCRGNYGVDPVPHPDLTAADSPIRLVAATDADLVLWISNQSFDDEEVQLTVVIDLVTVVEGDFRVEGQHNWVRFPLAVSSSEEHTITVYSDSGAMLRESFQVPPGKKRYAAVGHWTDGEGKDGEPHLTWRFQLQPIVFA